MLMPYWYAIPAWFDALGSWLLNYGYIFTQPSIIQMMTSLNVLTAAIFSYFFLGRRFTLYHNLALIWIFVGTGIVSLYSVLYSY